MKKLLIALGIAGVIGIVLLAFMLFKAAGIVREAHGKALYSSIGAWTRIQEFARTEGKSNYIAEADSRVTLLGNDLKEWRANAEGSGLDLTKFEKMRTTAYETTDRNIKNGLNPLAYLDAP